MLSHTLIVIHTFDSKSRGCTVTPWSFAHSFGSRCQCWLCNAHLFLSVFRVIFPQRSFHFVFFFFFLLRCLLCAFAAASQLGPALILLIFKLGDASPCLNSPPLSSPNSFLSCPSLSVCPSVDRAHASFVLFLRSNARELKRINGSHSPGWTPVSPNSSPPPPPLCYLCLFLTPSSIIISLGSSPF